MTGNLLGVYGNRALEIERGQGVHLYDRRGRAYLDFLSGIGVNALGHGHPAVVEAIREQAGLCIHTSNLHGHRYQEELAALLANWSGLDRVFFSNSGTEAVEAALKAARALANRKGRTAHRIIALENSFHGRTAGALAVTGQPKYRAPFTPLVPDVVFVPANDVAALEAAADEDTIAIIAETIQGEGGIYPLSPAFLAAIRRLCDARDALWIADETQCGLGRTGRRFAFQWHDAVGGPDVVVTAKPLAAGLPLGAVMFNAKAASAFTAGAHGTTFGGGPLTCRVALVVLGEIDRLLPAIRLRGAHLHRRLNELAARHPVIREVRGQGLMAGLELRVSGEPIVAAALERGLVINCTHGNVLRLLPPYLIEDAHIEEACAVLGDILARPLQSGFAPDYLRVAG